MASFLYVDGVYSINIHGNMVIVDEDHPNYVEIANCLETATEDELEVMTNVKQAKEAYVVRSGDGRATVADGVVMFDGEPVHNVITNRIQDHMRANVPFDNLLRFLENVEDNPSSTSREELYDFLENTGLPITEDGCFLAWKGVDSEFMDKWSGEYDNSPGKSPEMPRRNVDDNRDRGCSHGLHVGAPKYAKDYAGTGRVILVKVNPKDAVSVPKDSSCQKLRCCTYEVLREVESDYSLDGVAVCNHDGTEILDKRADEVLNKEHLDCTEPIEVHTYVWTPPWENVKVEPKTYGVKPEGGVQAGRRYHNRRDTSGCFAKK